MKQIDDTRVPKGVLESKTHVFLNRNRKYRLSENIELESVIESNLLKRPGSELDCCAIAG